MWAYETEPDTPIQIPIPAPSAVGVALLAGVGVILRSRRRFI
jgi:LPXTG-motif cell wall-anchored protein